MLSLFRSNQLLLSVLLLFYALLLHLSTFIIPVHDVPTNEGVLSTWVLDWIGRNGLFSNVIALLLVFFQAVWINVFVAKHRLASSVSLFPGLFYIFIASLFPDFLYLSPPLLANTFYIFALFEIMEVYKKASCADRIFNIAFWISVASLFYLPYIVMIILGFIGLGILRGFNITERLILLVGILVPYILVGTWTFWTNQFDQFIQHHFQDNFAFFVLPHSFDTLTLVQLIIFGLFLFFVLFSRNQYLHKRKIQAQKNIDILYWAILIGGLTIIFQSNISLEHLLILAPPIGILLSFNFLTMNNRWAEVIHFLLLLGVLIFQYRSWLIS